MEQIQQAILNFFSNEKLLKNIRTGAIIVILLLIPFVYFGYKDTFSFGALWSWDFGAAIAVITFSILLATIETKSVSYFATLEIDEEIIPLQDTIETNGKEIDLLDKKGKKSIIWCNDYNKDQQDMYNDIKTNNKIDLYEKRALKHRLNNKEKKAVWYDHEIDNLKDNSLIDKKFTPYKIERIRNVEKIGVKITTKKGDNETKSNPRKVSMVSIILGMPIRAAGLGILGTIPFMINESIGTVFVFYIGYLLTMVITILTQYLITSYKTSHGYKKALRKIISLQKILLLHLDKLKESN